MSCSTWLSLAEPLTQIFLEYLCASASPRWLFHRIHLCESGNKKSPGAVSWAFEGFLNGYCSKIFLGQCRIVLFWVLTIRCVYPTKRVASGPNWDTYNTYRCSLRNRLKTGFSCSLFSMLSERPVIAYRQFDRNIRPSFRQNNQNSIAVNY